MLAEGEGIPMGKTAGRERERWGEERHQDPAGGREPEAELRMENVTQMGMGGRHISGLFLKL